jgi:hypothetical protein
VVDRGVLDAEDGDLGADTYELRAMGMRRHRQRHLGLGMTSRWPRLENRAHAISTSGCDGRRRRLDGDGGCGRVVAGRW